jgi:hypothetical protein
LCKGGIIPCYFYQCHFHHNHHNITSSGAKWKFYQSCAPIKKWGFLHFSQPGKGVNKPHHIITQLQVSTYLTRSQCRLLWPQGNLCWYRMIQLVLLLCCNLDQHSYCHLVHPSCMSDQQNKNIICNILCFQGMVVTGAYKVTTVNT